MVSIIEIDGFQQFEKYVNNLNPNSPPVYIYFTGSKLPSGESWCPDCAEVEPILMEFIKSIAKPMVLACVRVGARDEWKDLNNPFRHSKDLKLLVIPTLIKWKGVKRLELEQCGKKDLLDLMVNDDDD